MPVAASTARASGRSCVPLTIASVIPARVAIPAACSFEVIPPEPRPEPDLALAIA